MPVVETLDEVTAAWCRSMTPAQRTLAGLELHTFARQMLFATVRASHPDWDQPAVEAEVSRRMLDGGD